MTDYSETATPKARRHFTSITFAKLLEKDAHGRQSNFSTTSCERCGFTKPASVSVSTTSSVSATCASRTWRITYSSSYPARLSRKVVLSVLRLHGRAQVFFFLDLLRTGHVKIVDLLASSFLDDLLELREEELAKEAEDANWFSAPSALRVYGQYLNLDTDHNGMLSKAELAKYGSGTLTLAFVERVFQECLTYEGEMDYKTYLDFVLAMENKQEPQAVQYFFRLLDVRAMGSLNVYDLHFFRSMQEMMQRNGQEVIGFQDVKDEIFDMVKPADPLRITLQDLISIGQGGTVVSILIDLNGFWTYENREVILAENAAAGGDQQQQQQQQPQEPVNI